MTKHDPTDSRIKMLSPETIDQIAAGEVILRPVSVVKELTENAIDAGARRISVFVEEGGKKAITITDDGCGIRYNELPLAFRRHATSKISFAEDLGRIRSLGFRGEALSSIIAVAEVEMTTRHRDEEIGSRITFQNGRMTAQSVAAWDRGSRICVRGLFSDIPARQKYLGKDDEEERLVRECVECLALSHPEIAFTYESGSVKTLRRVFQTPGNGELLSAAASIFGKNTARAFHPFQSDNAPMTITGLIGDLDLRRTHRDFQRFFVNGRYVQSPQLQQAYEQAWEGLLMQHQHPAGIICIELPPQYLDVNVHPQKTQIRLLNETLTMLLFRQGIRDALRGLNLISSPVSAGTKAPVGEEAAKRPYETEALMVEPAAKEAASQVPGNGPSMEEQISLKSVERIDLDHLEEKGEGPAPDQPPEAENPEAQSGTDSGEKPVSLAAVTTGESPVVLCRALAGVSERVHAFEGESGPEVVCLEIKPEKQKTRDPMARILAAIPPSRHLARPEFSRLRICGTLFQTYILLEEFGRVFLIDQHAAHEAVLYEQLREHLFRKTGFPAQQRLIPKSVSVTPDEAERFEHFREEILRFGFEADRMGEDRLAVRAVPVILGEEQDAEMIREIIALFDEKKDPTRGLKRIISMSCKKAVKGGEALSRAEIEKLLARLETLDNPYTCPHGRPVILKLSENELRKLFKRIV